MYEAPVYTAFRKYTGLFPVILVCIMSRNIFLHDIHPFPTEPRKHPGAPEMLSAPFLEMRESIFEITYDFLRI
jgi:hypothetical protein